MTTARVPRILAIADRPGWAIDGKARNLRRALAGRFEIVRRFQHEVSEDDVRAADIVLIFYWLELLKIPLPEPVLARSAKRLLIGICGHAEISGDRRARGLDALRRLAHAVFVSNRALEREFAPLLDVPIYYTPNGVDTALFCPASEPPQRDSGKIRVGWAGSLGNFGPEQRGFHDVIEPAIAATSGATLLTAIREQHWRDHDEMPGFYRGLDVYVCASRSEGTPNPCLEAAACGVPLVTTRVGSMPELVQDGENGLFFDGSVDDLAGKLAVLRDSPQFAVQLAARMLETVPAWDWREMAENYAGMFDAMLNREIAPALENGRGKHPPSRS